MKNWILALAALTVVGSGCSPIVLEPLESHESLTPIDDEGAAASSSLLAIRAGDAVWTYKGSDFLDGKPWTFGKPWSDPDSLVLFFSSDIQECSDPLLAPRCTSPAPFWQTVVVIPPELARPGLLELRDPRVIGYSRVTFFDGSIDCGGGAGLGPILSGTLEIISSGPSSLSVKLRDGVKNVDGTVLDGDYTAQLCGVPPLVSTPTPALAIRGVDLPPAPGSTPPGGGETLDPDTLFVFLGTVPATCQDPWSSADCSTGSRLTFRLPLSLQQPGLIDLSDPAIAATYTLAGSVSSSTCGQPSGAFEGGTIEILSSDANGLSFKVHGSYSDVTADGPFGLDGLYAASICP